MGNATYRQARLSGIDKRLSGIGKCVYRATTSDDRARRRRPTLEITP
jgi:hypothetical protein